MKLIGMVSYVILSGFAGWGISNFFREFNLPRWIGFLLVISLPILARLGTNP